MASTLPPFVSPADPARGLRASALVPPNDRAQPRPGVDSATQPSAAAVSGPAVINHVRGTASTSEPAAESSDDAVDEKTASKSSPEQAEKARNEESLKLKQRDAEVRAHEQAHAAAGGAFAGSPSYQYQRGPDGGSYAVGGEVPIDVSAISGDPEATIAKMEQVKRAALAPRDPSDADRAIAATADAQILAARHEQMTASAQGTSGDESTDDDEASTQPSIDASAGAAARQAFGESERRFAAAAGYAPAQLVSSQPRPVE